MTKILAILTDEEVRRCAPADDEAGFGALSTGKGMLPLKAVDVHTRIDGLLAETTLSQQFVNSFDEPLEATYIFPLPDRFAVTRFRMEVAGRVIEGVLKERGEARRDYQQAIESGRRAAITEEERAGVFTLRVGNLMPGEEATICLTMSGPLAYSDGEATFRFPLVVAPRYIPGVALPGPSVGDGYAPDTDAVPDASRITPPVLLPGMPNPVRLSLDVEVHAAGLTMQQFRSSLHSVIEEGSEVRRIRLQPGERLNRDFILRFSVGEKAVQTALVLHSDAGLEEGTFLLTIVPPTGQAQAPRPRDVVFVLDRSGSMAGWKMVAARRALGRMVDTLTNHDHFAVYAFDDSVETMPQFGGTGLIDATDRNRFRAVEFLAKIDSRGGTEMARPLQEAVKQLTNSDPKRDRILVLLTDGQVGNEDQILHALGNKLREMRIFTLGIDQAVNAAFLKRLAGLGGGYCELVESEDRLDEVMDRVHRRIGTPLLTGVKFESDKIEINRATITPARLPDLFAGTPLIIMGRYRGSSAGAIKLQAHNAVGKTWSELVHAQKSDNKAITSVWARGHVRELEDRYVTEASRKHLLEKQIIEASLRFGVLCRFTAFIAADVKEVVNPSGQVHRVIQPVEATAGWKMLGTDMPEERMATAYCLASPAAEMADITDFDPEGALALAPKRKTRSLRSKARRKQEQVQSPASPPAGKAGGVIRGLISSVFGGNASPNIPPAGASFSRPSEPFDLTAYRRRALEMLQQLQAAGASDRLHALGILSMQLIALLEDLKSVGVDKSTIQLLEELHDELRQVLDQSAATSADLEKLWIHCEEVLQQFGKADVTVSRSEGFWK